jgi:hypothetical protein
MTTTVTVKTTEHPATVCYGNGGTYMEPHSEFTCYAYEGSTVEIIEHEIEDES